MNGNFLTKISCEITSLKGAVVLVFSDVGVEVIFCGVAIFRSIVLVDVDARDVAIFCGVVLVGIDARDVAIFHDVVLVDVNARNVAIFRDVDKTVVLVGVGVEAIFRGGVDVVYGDGVDEPAISGEGAFTSGNFIGQKIA
ncbi:hypothetical protein RCL_jg9911.t1 [Rhizophagus clarus]|uniref:Uncharacterized protein n=1 Tax=Rhizophagus clarus TaxID=94130 RepID=A0A8H3QCM1_9GLOM|nr:hypothetical protein RCL_jg9911.t1 [Rhizophagus clarus]